MATEHYNLTPTIGDARRIAKQNHLRRCVILFETQMGQVGYASYGETKTLCQGTRRIMDLHFEDIEGAINSDSDLTL